MNLSLKNLRAISKKTGIPLEDFLCVTGVPGDPIPVKTAGEARAAFLHSDGRIDSPEREDAHLTWISLCSTVNEATKAYDEALDDTKARKAALLKIIELSSNGHRRRKKKSS